MSNYTKENLIAVPSTDVPAGTLAIKVGNEIFTPGNIKIASGMEFYKCASVDTVNKTWTGYKAVLENEFYVFESAVTSGLTYGGAFTPNTGYIYDADATIQVHHLWQGSPIDYALYANLSTISVETGQPVEQHGGEFTEIAGVKCYSASSSRLSFSSLTLNAGTGMTYAIRIYPRRFSGWQNYVTLQSSSDQFNLWANNGAIGMWYTSSSLWSPITLSETKWYHCALTYIDGVVSLYIDGVKYTSNTSMNFGEVTGCIVGLNMDACDAAFADFKVYDRALSESEIVALSSEPIK